MPAVRGSAIGASRALRSLAAFSLVLSFATAGPGIALGEDGLDSMIPIELPIVDLGLIDTDSDGMQNTTTIVPADPRSEQVTAVEALVTVPGGVDADLVEVTLCLFLVASEAGVARCSPDGGLDSPWGSESPDATTHLVMTWRPDRVVTSGGVDPGGEDGPVVVLDHGFRILGDNQHEDADSTSDLVGLGAEATEVSLTFRFRTSVALRAGDEAWAVRVVALDANGNHSAGSDPEQTTDTTWQRGALTVAEFRAVLSRSPVAFGALLPGGAITVAGITSGSFIANAPSALTIASTDFVHDGGTAGSSVISVRGASGEPDAAELTLDCSAGPTFDPSRALRVANTPGADEFLESDLYAMGTGEIADTSRMHSCRMTYGGGATAVGRQHSGTIAISIVPAP
jgi:hypothetical protein